MYAGRTLRVAGRVVLVGVGVGVRHRSSQCLRIRRGGGPLVPHQRRVGLLRSADGERDLSERRNPRHGDRAEGRDSVGRGGHAERGVRGQVGRGVGGEVRERVGEHVGMVIR